MKWKLQKERKKENINKTKSWFFETINKIDKPLARFIKKETEEAQINKIVNEREFTSKSTKIQKVDY